MFYPTCQICHEKTQDIISHLKSHRVAAIKYFTFYYKKKDLITGKLIPFKSFEQWHLSDFCDKRNLKSWLKKSGVVAAENYLAQKLKEYIYIKKWPYCPSQSLLGSIYCLPKINDFETFCKKPFETFCAENNIKSPFNYSAGKILCNNNITQIVIDSREKRPLIIKDKNINIVIDSLSYGDYALDKNSKIVIERKSKSDFFGTLSKEYERFKRQIERAKLFSGYIIILVECSLSSIMYKKNKWGNISPEFVLHRMREISRENDNVQFLFCNGRGECSRLLPIILGLNDDEYNITSLDLQYYYDKKML